MLCVATISSLNQVENGEIIKTILILWNKNLDRPNFRYWHTTLYLIITFI